MGVNLGGFQALMSEDFLYMADAGAVLVHVGCATVAKQVAGTVHFDVAGFKDLFYPRSEISA